jgi:hypothetical protein
MDWHSTRTSADAPGWQSTLEAASRKNSFDFNELKS